MSYSNLVTDKVFAYLLRKGVIQTQDTGMWKTQADEKSSSPLEIMLKSREDLCKPVAQLIAKLTNIPYRDSCNTEDIKNVSFDAEKAFIQLESGDSFRAVLDPICYPADERSSLEIIDYQFFSELLEKQKIREEQENEVKTGQKCDVSSKPYWDICDGDANDQIERILSGSIELGASDIHIDLDEVDEKLVCRIRFRIDGKCRDMVIDPRKSIYEGIVSRLKTLSYCRLDESRVPQDGRVPFVHKGKNYEFRISFNPVTKKNEQLEKVVMRQMADVNKCNLEMLGIHEYNLKYFKEAISLPYGFNIVTGPTGSGKTTTLYSVLQEVDRGAKNVCSIEEPIEAEIKRVNQTQVRHDIGLDFARVLRALLRQDPDVIMVGEMRDLETAETALDAALTGHVVWSTLHTNSAVASISRLIQMGIKDYMAANALAFIVAQRLVQRLCSECKVLDPNVDQFIKEQARPVFSNAHPEVAEVFEKTIVQPQLYMATNRDGNTCEKCGGLGFKGRAGVMEVLKMNDAIREIILKDQGNEMAMQQAAIDGGMMTMAQYGMIKVLEGNTTWDAVLSVIRS